MHQDGDDVFITRVEDEFILALASIQDSELTTVGARWQQTETLTDWEVGEVCAALREILEFARHARSDGRPVLQLNVL